MTKFETFGRLSPAQWPELRNNWRSRWSPMTLPTTGFHHWESVPTSLLSAALPPRTDLIWCLGKVPWGKLSVRCASKRLMLRCCSKCPWGWVWCCTVDLLVVPSRYLQISNDSASSVHQFGIDVNILLVLHSCSTGLSSLIVHIFCP